MLETLTMSTKERQRLQILGHLKHGKTTVVKAAAALGISERQMYRVLDRYRCQGDRGLIYRLRGHTSNQGYPVPLQSSIRTRIQLKNPPTHSSVPWMHVPGFGRQAAPQNQEPR